MKFSAARRRARFRRRAMTVGRFIDDVVDGFRSRFPPCCIIFFVTSYRKLLENPDWNNRSRDPYPHGYVRCPACIRDGWIAEYEEVEGGRFFELLFWREREKEDLRRFLAREAVRREEFRVRRERAIVAING